jgi:hypothetical protein
MYSQRHPTQTHKRLDHCVQDSLQGCHSLAALAQVLHTCPHTVCVLRHAHPHARRCTQSPAIPTTECHSTQIALCAAEQQMHAPAAPVSRQRLAPSWHPPARPRRDQRDVPYSTTGTASTAMYRCCWHMPNRLLPRLLPGYCPSRCPSCCAAIAPGRASAAASAAATCPTGCPPPPWRPPQPSPVCPRDNAPAAASAAAGR